RRGVLTDHVVDRIADVLEQRERADADDEHHERGLPESAKDECQHRPEDTSRHRAVDPEATASGEPRFSASPEKENARRGTGLEVPRLRGASIAMRPGTRPGGDQKLWTTPMSNDLLPVPDSV